MMKSTFVVLTMSALFVISGCTADNVYKSFQADKSSCRKLPESQREACGKRVDSQMTYDEYKKERQKL